MGNIYTGSLFLGLLSLLENSSTLKTGDRIALFSYGSGAVSEIFSGQLVAGFKQRLQTNRIKMLNNRTPLSIPDYEKIFFEEARLDQNGSASFMNYENQNFALTEIVEHQRRYIKVEK